MINFKDYRVILLIAALLSFIIILPLKFSLSIFNPIHPYNGNTYTFTPINYLFTEFSVIVKYIQLLFLPINQNLDYDFPVSDSFFEIRTLLCFLLIISLLILAVFFFKKYRIISFGILWFFLTLMIESSFIPLADVIFEHRTYLPSVGFFLIITSGIYVLLWKKYKYVAISIFAIIVVSNAVLTFERNRVWKDDLSLWSDVVSKSPGKAQSVNNRGMAYNSLGQRDNAIADFTKAIELSQGYADAYTNRGNIYATNEQWGKAIADYTSAIAINPKDAEAYNNRGNVYVNIEQWQKAIADYSKTIELNPDYTNSYSYREYAYQKMNSEKK